LAESEPPAPDAAELLVLASLRRRLLGGSSWVFFGRIATIILGIGINALLARLLEPRELGSYFTSYTLAFSGALIAQLGLDRAVVRIVSAARGTNQPGRARHAIRRILSIGAVGGIVVAVILTFGLGPWLAHHLFHSELIAHAMPLIGGWLLANAIQSLFVETFRGLQRFDLATVLDALLVDVLLGATFGALVVFGARMQLASVLAISAGATALVAIVAGQLLRGQVRALGGEGRVVAGEIFSIAWPSLITNTAIYFLGLGVDVLVLGAFRPQQDVAIYGAASRLVMLVATPLWILGGVLPPLISELHAQGKRKTLETTLRAGATLAGLPSLAVLLVYVFFGRSVLGYFFGPFYRQGALVLGILSTARLLSVWAGSCGMTLMMTGHQKTMMYITASTGLLSVTAGILITPHFGAPGLAMATASMVVLQNVLQLLAAHRLVGVWTHVQLSPRALVNFLSAKPGKASKREG